MATIQDSRAATERDEQEGQRQWRSTETGTAARREAREGAAKKERGGNRDVGRGSRARDRTRATERNENKKEILSRRGED